DLERGGGFRGAGAEMEQGGCGKRGGENVAACQHGNSLEQLFGGLHLVPASRAPVGRPKCHSSRGSRPSRRLCCDALLLVRHYTIFADEIVSCLVAQPRYVSRKPPVLKKVPMYVTGEQAGASTTKAASVAVRTLVQREYQ